MEARLTLSTASPISPLSLESLPPFSLSLTLGNGKPLRENLPSSFFGFPSFFLSSSTLLSLFRISLLFSQAQLPSRFLFSLSSSLFSGFAFPTIFAATTFSPHPSFCSHLFCLRDPSSESSSTCQSLTATSKSEVDSLWPLRMWHVARWDSDTWLKMWSAKTNREKVTHA